MNNSNTNPIDSSESSLIKIRSSEINSNKFKQPVFIRDILNITNYSVNSKTQTHILKCQDEFKKFFYIPLKITSLEELIKLYQYQSKHKCLIMCNPGENCHRNAFFDIDATKPEKGINLSEKQVYFLEFLFKKVCELLAGKPVTVYRMRKRRPDLNTHLMAKLILPNKFWQVFIINMIRNIFLNHLNREMKIVTPILADIADMEFSEKEVLDMIKACDDAPGDTRCL